MKSINISAACIAAKWHSATAIDAIVAQGMTRKDAESYCDYVFSEHALTHGGVVNDDWTDAISDAQEEQLSLIDGHWHVAPESTTD